jgi:hypothetical protein
MRGKYFDQVVGYMLWEIRIGDEAVVDCGGAQGGKVGGGGGGVGCESLEDGVVWAREGNVWACAGLGGGGEFGGFGTVAAEDGDFAVYFCCWWEVRFKVTLLRAFVAETRL